MTLEERIENAKNRIFSSAQVDGSHHKMWTLDQVLRILTDCPLEKVITKDSNNIEYTYEERGESKEYKNFIKSYCEDEETGDEYTWNCGTPP